MRMEEYSDLYRVRSTPWLLIVSAVVVVAVIIAICVSGGDEEDEVEVKEEKSSEVVEAPVVENIVKKEEVAPQGMSTAELDKIIEEGKDFESKSIFVKARESYLKAYEALGESVYRKDELEESIGRVSTILYISQRPMDGKVVYEIKSGDFLSSIASRFNCPVEYIQKCNNIGNANSIRPGKTIILADHPEFLIKVSKTQNILWLTLNGRFFKKYLVGTGEYGKTPEGTFKIVDKTAEPVWWPGDGRPSIPYGNPENILGTRWMALEATGDTMQVSGYGIHGTWDDSSLGKQSSAGCVRMKNSDVEEIYMMVPRGTKVEIVE